MSGKDMSLFSESVAFAIKLNARIIKIATDNALPIFFEIKIPPLYIQALHNG